MEYVLVIRRAEGGGYWAEVPAVKGCFVQADTLDGLLADAPKAISSHLEALTEGGQQASTDHGIIIATVTTSEPLADVSQGPQVRFSPSADHDEYPIPSGAGVPGQEDVPGENEAAASVIATGVRGTARGRLAQTAREAAAVLIIWGLFMGAYLLWNALDARGEAPGPQASAAPVGATASPGAAQAAPTTTPSAPTIPPNPAAVFAPPAVTPLATPTAASPASTPTAGDGYLVEQGETLWAISQRFGLTVEEVMRANDLTDRSFVMAGQRLVIPEARR